MNLLILIKPISRNQLLSGANNTNSIYGISVNSLLNLPRAFKNWILFLGKAPRKRICSVFCSKISNNEPSEAALHYRAPEVSDNLSHRPETFVVSV